MSLEFLLTTLVVVLVPGAGAIYTISHAINGGRKGAIIGAFAATLGIVPHILASILGVTAIMHLSAQAFTILKWIGAVYLIYLGITMISKNSKLSFTEAETESKPLSIISKGVFIGILNPKLTLFFLSFLPQFIVAEAGNTQYQLVMLALVFMVITFAVFIIYGLMASYAKTFLLNSPKILKRIEQSLGAILIGLAVKLALIE